MLDKSSHKSKTSLKVDWITLRAERVLLLDKVQGRVLLEDKIDKVGQQVISNKESIEVVALRDTN